VGQGVYLFHASALDNIRYGRPGASQAEVEAAARLADAHEFISQLPDGYDTLLGDRGTRISGGQRQRIALARAIVRQPDLLILDEATNAVDALSEHVIQGTLEQLGSRCTILLIAHRLSTIEHADRILVLEGGRLIEEGRLGDLARTGGLFTRLYDLPAPRAARP
jgi:ABC-type multidrug transport system fused ATPase/permease subunit